MKKELIYTYLNGEATPAQEQELFEWISASEQNKAEFLDIKALWGARERFAVEEDPQQIFRSLRAARERLAAPAVPLRKHPSHFVGWGIAAMVAVMLAVSGFVVGHRMHQSAVESYYTYTNTEPAMKYIVLGDGTRVWLAQGSTLRHSRDFTPRDRSVKLDGEAFFDVTSDKDHPFFVNTSTVCVKVVGTSFNVKMYKDTDDTEVVLERGVVKLKFNDSNNLITMRPGQKVLYSAESADISISEVDVEYMMLLKYGMISMSDVRLDEVIAKIEEVYNVRIEPQTPLDNKLRYNFNFLRSNTIDDVLNIVDRVSGVKCRAVEQSAR